MEKRKRAQVETCGYKDKDKNKLEDSRFEDKIGNL